jgi:hypothetical protein
MNAPAREPHLAFNDRAAVLDEIDRLFWAIRCHADTGQSFTATETVDGIDLAFKHIRACLLRLAELKKGLANEEP